MPTAGASPRRGTRRGGSSRGCGCGRRSRQGTVRRLHGHRLPDGEILEYALALTRQEARECLGARTDGALMVALDLLEEAGYFRPASDRPERWIKRRPTDLRGPGRDRLLLFAGTTDPLMLRRWLRAIKFDRKHGAAGAWSDSLRR